jgi:7-keto-8-aminopelargonate synthetase-like enzyme
MPLASSALRAGREERLSFVAEIWSLARAAGLIYRVAEDDRFDGRAITLAGRRLVNFGSCSYLGLETDARLKTAACEAILRYGVQFSTSRAYVTAPLYREYEELLSEMAGGAPVVLAATASLAHQSALPVLVGERDAVLYDIQVHASVQASLPELRMRGIPCEPVRHNRLDRLEERIKALSAQHDRVFYLCDGIYSMHGDVIDVDGLYELLDRHPALFAYVDDAHGVSWSGRHGAGTVLGRRRIHSRMAVIFGLSKSFAAAGGAIVLPNPELAERVLTCGRTLIFSGPLQPAQLGAGIASAKIHLSEELLLRQHQLQSRIEQFDRVAARENVGVICSGASPIRFVPVGDERAAVDVAAALLAKGFYVNVACYPAVPRRRAGVRLMLNTHQNAGDIQSLVNQLSERLNRGTRRAPSSPGWALPRPIEQR